MRDPVGYLERLHRTYGPVAALAEGKARYVFVFGPELNERVLGDTETFHNVDADSSPLRIPGSSSLGRLYAGLTNMNGERHRRHRRVLAAALQRKHVDRFCADFGELAERMVAEWRVGEVRDLLPELKRLTLAVAVKTLLGLEPERDGRGVSVLVDRWLAAVFSVPALLLPIALPGLPYRRLLLLSDRLEHEIAALIERKRSGGSSADLLSALLEARDDDGSGLTDDELLGQTAFLFMAGHATTASALAWTLLLLSLHPATLDDVLNELEQTCAGEAPDTTQIGELRLLDAVVRESMRLLPPVTWWTRVATTPTELGGYRVPAGTRVGYSPYVTHRLPNVYSQPNTFCPERWFGPRPEPYAYVPFSAGPRTCLGAAFAMTELKSVLAVVLQRVGLSLAPGARVRRGGLMLSEPKPGLWMRVDAAGSRPSQAGASAVLRDVAHVA